MLEVDRMKELNVKALIIQKVLRCYKYRYGTKSCYYYYCNYCHYHLAHVTSCLYDSCPPKKTVPEEKGRRSCYSEILERTQRQTAVQSGESWCSLFTKVKIQASLAINPFNYAAILGAAWLCKATGPGSFSPTPLPVQEETSGSHRAADPSQRIPGQEGMEAQEERCDPPAGTDQRFAGKSCSQKEEKTCKFNLNNYEEPFLGDDCERSLDCPLGLSGTAMVAKHLLSNYPHIPIRWTPVVTLTCLT